jgi:hypothetical protein
MKRYALAVSRPLAIQSSDFSPYAHDFSAIENLTIAMIKTGYNNAMAKPRSNPWARGRYLPIIATDEAIAPIAMLITTRNAFSSFSIIFSLYPQLAPLRGWIEAPCSLLQSR